MEDSSLEHQRSTVRQALIELRDQEGRIRDDRAGWLRRGVELGMRKAELARMAGISRDNVYDLLNRLLDG